MSTASARNSAIEAVIDDVVAGLRKNQKELPCKYFYDDRGSRLFDRICLLPEYYLTRTEIGIMRRYEQEIASCVGPEAVIVEFGSGSGVKTRELLKSLADPVAYVPIEIADEHLRRTAAQLARELPHLSIHPINADYTRSLELPELPVQARRRVVFFPGSTIGNFEPPDAARFLARIRQMVGEGGGLLIGVDLKKDPCILHAAYNDRAGVTAQFNKNILLHLNGAIGSSFEPGNFRHYAYYEPQRGCIEMHLVSLRDQHVVIDGNRFNLSTGESIRTERSYKYNVAQFEELASRAGFTLLDVWMDDEQLFSVQCYEVSASRRR